MATPRPRQQNPVLDQTPQTASQESDAPSQNQKNSLEGALPGQVGGTPTHAVQRDGIKRAMVHLTAMKNSLSALEAFSSPTMQAPSSALRTEMERLVVDLPYYRDAAALLFVGTRPE